MATILIALFDRNTSVVCTNMNKRCYPAYQIDAVGRTVAIRSPSESDNLAGCLYFERVHEPGHSFNRSGYLRLLKNPRGLKLGFRPPGKTVLLMVAVIYHDLTCTTIGKLGTMLPIRTLL